MRYEHDILNRLEAYQEQLRHWGTPGLQALQPTKDEMTAWIRALEWVLGRDTGAPKPRE